MEGITDIKKYQLCNIMRSRALPLIRLQETWDPCSGCSDLYGGYVYINSGKDDGCRSHAGVGFLVAPGLKRSIYSCKHISDRICILKLRVPGGKLVIINAYAPHGGYDYNTRQVFFNLLREVYAGTSCHGLKLIVGDLNSRIHIPNASDADPLEPFGPYCFGKPDYNASARPESNRELLLELCIACELCVANTYLQPEEEHQVTYHEIWQSPVETIRPSGFAQLDLMLVPHSSLWQIASVRSDRWQALASHHFLLEAVLRINIEKTNGSQQFWKRCDITTLKDTCIRNNFASRFAEIAEMKRYGCNLQDAGSLNDMICTSLHDAAAQVLPAAQARRLRPWIGEATLELICSRDAARKQGHRQTELLLNKQVRGSAKNDRTKWLNDIAGKGTWESIRQLKKRPKVSGRKLRNSNGELVESCNRAETFAKHLETVQWAVPHVTAVPDQTAIGTPLPTCVGPLTEEEVTKAVKQLKNGKAAVEVPAEVLKAICARMNGALLATPKSSRQVLYFARCAQHAKHN